MPSIIFSPKSLQVYNIFQINCHNLYPSYHKYYHFFFLSGFSFTNIHDSQDSRRRGRLYLFNSSLPPSLVSQTFKRQPGDYWRVFISAHSWQPNSNGELLVSERKSLTIELSTLNHHEKNGYLSTITQYGFVLFGEDLGLLNIIQ